MSHLPPSSTQIIQNLPITNIGAARSQMFVCALAHR